MDRGGWWATVHGAAKSWKQLKQLARTPKCSGAAPVDRPSGLEKGQRAGLGVQEERMLREEPGLLASLKFPTTHTSRASTLATSYEELTHWKRPWCWEGLGAGGEGVDRGWDGWMASPTRWTWVWVNSGSWWQTRRPGVLQSMGSQRVRHNWVTELNWSFSNFLLEYNCFTMVC